MGTMLLEELVENLDDEDFGDFEANPNLGLGEEPESLLNYLRARRNQVMKSHHRYLHGIPLRMEMLIYNSLVFQLDYEPTHHWSNVSEFMDIASKWID